MRIEIGPDGKIIGTRRVSPNGQVSGLTEYSGREVLVILAGTSSPDSVPFLGSSEAMTHAVEEQMRQAYQRYDLLQKLYATPWEATRSFVRATFGPSAPDLVAEVDRWVQDQLRKSTVGGSSAPSGAVEKPLRASPTGRRAPSHRANGRSKKGRR
ncbi:MAG: hypothetical protein WCA77_07205 [Thermoplasmata archaeon]